VPARVPVLLAFLAGAPLLVPVVLLAARGRRMSDLVRVADVAAERVRWLWPGRLPLAKVAVVDGDPGLGKSTVMLTVAANLTTGSPFPDGHRPEVADAIILSAEDDIADTIRPRLEAAAANLERCWVLPDVHPEGEPPRPPELPADLNLLESLVKEKAAALVVIDPIAAFLSSTVDMHRDQDVRRVLAGLAYLAARTGATVTVIRHLNKHSGGNPLYRGGGSIGIVGAARAGLLAALDPDDEHRRILAVTKSNLAAVPDALAYRLVEDELRGVARVVWDGTTGHTAADLLRVRPADDDEQAPARAEAEEILRGILGNGPVLARQVKAKAREAGVSERTLDRARVAIGAITKREGFGPGSQFFWALPEEAILATESPSSPSSPAQEPLAPMASMDGYGEHEDDDPGRWTR
jgi:AAA domain